METKTLREVLVEILLFQSRRKSRVTERFSEETISGIVKQASEIFISESTLLRLHGRFVIIGDIHGNLGDLIRIFQTHEYPPETKYILLGDYVDRGFYSLEVILLLYTLKILFPEHIYILRGNHEVRQTSRNFGFRSQCIDYLSRSMYHLFVKSFNNIPLAAVVNDKIFCVHGGISPFLNTLKQINKIKRPLQIIGNPIVTDMLWSDPSPDIGTFKESPRGNGHLYGSDALSQFLEDNDLTTLIRAHEFTKNGFDWPYDDQSCLTVFSSCDYCGLKNLASIAIVNENSQICIEVFAAFTPEMFAHHRVILPSFLLQSPKAVLAPIPPLSQDLFLDTHIELPLMI